MTPRDIAAAVATAAQRDPLADVKAIYAMTIAAMMRGVELKVVYTFKEPPRAGDFAQIEKWLNRLLSVCARKGLGLKVPRRWARLNMASLQHSDDGEHSITVRVDCGKLIPGERTAEWLEAAAQIEAAAGLQEHG